jgi:hypothetical protein
MEQAAASARRPIGGRTCHRAQRRSAPCPRLSATSPPAGDGEDGDRVGGIAAGLDATLDTPRATMSTRLFDTTFIVTAIFFTPISQ